MSDKIMAWIKLIAAVAAAIILIIVHTLIYPLKMLRRNDKSSKEFFRLVIT
jgi:signal transduction histidine kinase